MAERRRLGRHRRACSRSWRGCAIPTAAALGRAAGLRHASRRTRSRKPTRSPTRSIAATCDDLKDELGDLLLQVVFHARMARGAGRFAFADVVAAISDKMVRRHPHVFAGAVGRRMPRRRPRAWEEHKRDERARQRRRRRHQRAGRHRPRPAGMAARGEAAEARRRASASTGPTPTPVFDKLHEEIEEVRAEFAAVGSRRRRCARPARGRIRRPAVRLRQPLAPCQGRFRRRAAPRQCQVRAPLPAHGGAGRRGGRRLVEPVAGRAGRLLGSRQGARKKPATPPDDKEPTDEPIRQLPRVLSLLPGRALATAPAAACISSAARWCSVAW